MCFTYYSKHNNINFSLVEYCILLVFLVSSCRQAGDTGRYTRQKDSLRTVCEHYALQLQTDSLRTAARQYQSLSESGSRDYFKSIHFDILADFNAHDYTKVLSRIMQVSSDPHFHEFPDICCRYQFTYARALQYTQQYSAAIAAFQRCLIYDSPVDSLRQNISVTVVNAMLQLMNTSLASGKHGECERYFRSLIARPMPIIRETCLRDLYSISAYTFFMNDDSRRAITTMDAALRMKYPRSEPDPQSLFRDYTYASAIYSMVPERQMQVMNLCEQALRIGYANSSVAGMEWLTAWFGACCRKYGKISMAIDLYRESIVISRKKQNVKGEIDAYNQLNDLYLYLGQYRQANQFADLALAKTRHLQDDDPTFMGGAYMRKASTMFQMGRMDSVGYYADRAEKYYRQLPYENGSRALEELRGEMYLKMPSTDLKYRGISCLRHVLSSERDMEARANIFCWLGKVYFQLNHVREGEAMLDSMYTSLQSFSTPVYVPGAYKFALSHYLKTGNGAMIKRYAAAFLQESDSSFNGQVAQKMSQFTVKYDTEKKEQQLRITNYELQEKKMALQLYIVLSVILLISLVSIITFLFYKRRINALKLQLMDQKFQALSDQLNLTSAQRESAEQELSSLLSDMSSKQHLEVLTPEMYRNDGENKFRSRFNQLHPSFISRLREMAPDVTKREEIFCMLIALQQNTDQISDIFCIEKKSINMMRYRVRIKLHLQRNDSLEDAIMQLL